MNGQTVSGERGAHVMHSLELFGEIEGDPAPLIYERLFAAQPDLKPLFVLDTDGSVRGSMLQHVFEVIFDYFDANMIAGNLIASSRLVHDGYGVPEGRFDSFFEVLRDACRDSLGDQWSADMEREWQDLLKTFSAFV